MTDQDLIAQPLLSEAALRSCFGGERERGKVWITPGRKRSFDGHGSKLSDHGQEQAVDWARLAVPRNQLLSSSLRQPTVT